jgi:hypothetical protein
MPHDVGATRNQITNENGQLEASSFVDAHSERVFSYQSYLPFLLYRSGYCLYEVHD